RSVRTKTSSAPIRDFEPAMAADIAFVLHPASAKVRLPSVEDRLAGGVADPRGIGRIAPGRFELPSRGLPSASSADPAPRITGPRPHRGPRWPPHHGAANRS